MAPSLLRQLGSTGLAVSRLGLGGHTFLAHYGGLERAERSELLAIVTAALEAGISYFDVTYDEERALLGELTAELRVRERIVLSAWMSRDRTQTAGELMAEAERRWRSCRWTTSMSSTRTGRALRNRLKRWRRPGTAV